MLDNIVGYVNYSRCCHLANHFVIWNIFSFNWRYWQYI